MTYKRLICLVAWALIFVPSANAGDEDNLGGDYALYSGAASGSFRAAQDTTEGDYDLYSGAASGSFRAAQDTNRWQLDSGLVTNEPLYQPTQGSEVNSDGSYSGLRLTLPLGRR